MSEKIKKVRVKQADGSMSKYIPIGVDSENIDMKSGLDLEEVLSTKPYYFNSVEEMKNANYLKDGDCAITLNYYSEYEGGGANYIISKNLPTLFYEILDNGLYAILISNKNKAASYGLNENLNDNLSIINKIKDVEEIDLDYNKIYKFSQKITLQNKKINGNKSTFKYTGPYQEDYFITINGNALPSTEGSGSVSINELFFDCSNNIYGVKVINSFGYNIDNNRGKNILKNGILLDNTSNGLLRNSRYRCNPSTTYDTYGIINNNADSITENCTCIDFKYGIYYKNGNQRLVNFHVWSSLASIYEISYAVLINTYAVILCENITCDTVKNVFKTENNYARFSCYGINCFNNPNVVNSGDFILLDLFGSVNNITVSGAFVTSQSSAIKIFTDEFINNNNMYTLLNNGNYDINLSTPYIKNFPVTQLINPLSQIFGSNQVVVPDLNRKINGLVNYASSAQNKPSDLGGVLLSLGMINSRGLQLAIDSNGIAFIRYYSTDNFGNWHQISNS